MKATICVCGEIMDASSLPNRFITVPIRADSGTLKGVIGCGWNSALASRNEAQVHCTLRCCTGRITELLRSVKRIMPMVAHHPELPPTWEKVRKEIMEAAAQ